VKQNYTPNTTNNTTWDQLSVFQVPDQQH